MLKSSTPSATPPIKNANSVSPSTSMSLSNTPGAAITSDPLTETMNASSTATGASLIGSTVMVTVATLLSSNPSFATYVNESVPWKSGFGV